MRSSRSSLFAPVGSALFAGLLMLAAGAVLPSSALACPEGGGACVCGDKCPAEHAGNCAKDAAGGCAGKDDKAAACSCPPGEEGNCACGAECGSKNGGKCDKAAAGEKKAGACGCSGAGAAGDKAAPCGAAAAEGAGAQRAVIDPVTGQLTVPDAAQAAEAAGAAPANAQAAATGNAAPAAQQIAVPGAGVMAPFPTNRVSHAVAKVDDSGNAHAGCEHAAE